MPKTYQIKVTKKENVTTVWMHIPGGLTDSVEIHKQNGQHLLKYNGTSTPYSDGPLAIRKAKQLLRESN